ncbi:hypothetical protein DICVIV_10768 [Dictyocaulus viviparus]|uniref:NADH dehydrogenase [ubiquinone] 1 subunit C2 n=1 Tax=Dictyocaulus viviparus TaxID=29172 RepID=A0A0D8XF64_DICVI|nr:hypothetical protein DICVIV_10768 [Dictyocaulus viviparus]
MGKDYKPCKFFQNVYKYMAESTKVSEKEIERREKYLRAGLREVNLVDPFTWPYPAKGAGTMLGLTLISGHIYNMWNKKPYYFDMLDFMKSVAGIVPRLFGALLISALGYGMGALREHHYKTRDAVIEHYIALHPQDFDHFKDRNGRPFADVLLPWYPRRTQYTKFD